MAAGVAFILISWHIRNLIFKIEAKNQEARSREKQLPPVKPNYFFFASYFLFLASLLLEYLLDLLGNGFTRRTNILPADLREFLQQLPLFGGQSLRDMDHHMHILIARGSSMHVRHALALEPKDLPALRSRWDLHRDRTIEGGDGNLRAQSSLHKMNGQLQVNIISIPLKNVMRQDTDIQIQVAGAGTADLSFPAYP